MTDAQPLAAERRARLNRLALGLAWATVAYNAVEATLALWAGAAAGSLALVSFGGDSVVECLSALMIIWQFRGDVPEERERAALKGIAVAFFALAAYVVFDAVQFFVTGADAEASVVGIALAATSLVVMPVLTVAKRRIGRELGSATVTADSVQTLLCTYLSAVLLVGLLLDATLGWSWADPLAALVVAGVALSEGREAWRGEDEG